MLPDRSGFGSAGRWRADPPRRLSGVDDQRGGRIDAPGARGNLGTDLIVGAAPSERAGAASAISETGTELGSALGIAILGRIGTAVSRNGITSALFSGVPLQAANAARDTLGGAVAVAKQLPPSVVVAAQP